MKDNAIKSAERRINRQNLNTSSTTCFACRGIGHAARDCPNVLLAAQGIDNDGTAALLGEGGEGGNKMKRGKGRNGGDVTGGGKCYRYVHPTSILKGVNDRCNSNQHSLSHCPQRADPKNPTPYATCFICLASGHISAVCPNNTKGVYVKGGSCKVCGSVQHRANDCPDDKREKRRRYDNEDNGEVPVVGDVGADEDDFMIKSREQIKAAAIAASFKEREKGKKKKHPPNNNGPREKYNKAADQGEEGQGLLAEIAPASVPARVERTEEKAASIPAVEVIAAPAPAPVVAPTPALPIKRTKPKVVKF
jgi:zinc finger CCHC domain-containing protein 9